MPYFALLRLACTLPYNTSSFELTDGANYVCRVVFIMCPFQAYSIASLAKKIAYSYSAPFCIIQ